MHYETVQVCIDDATIAAGDAWTIIEPVWWLANIYVEPKQYELSLLQFSRPQRLVFAIFWYCAELNNGGHHQFYSNPTGIVWKDALEGFRSMDALEFATVLEQSAQRLGGSPSLDYEERHEQLKEFDPDFQDLDDLFYKAQDKSDLDARIIAFIRSHASGFYFEGEIRRPILPGREKWEP